MCDARFIPARATNNNQPRLKYVFNYCQSSLPF
jgi:hypothetical protein